MSFKTGPEDSHVPCGVVVFRKVKKKLKANLCSAIKLKIRNKGTRNTVPDTSSSGDWKYWL